MTIMIDGIGVVGGFGSGAKELLAAAQAGGCAPETASLSAEGTSQEVPVYRARTDHLTDFVSKRALRRVDHLSRMALLGAHLALEDAGNPALDPQRTGIIVASGYGATGTTFAFLDSVLGDGDACASPTHFSSSVHNAAAANLSIQLKLEGPCLTLSQFEQSVFSAFSEARIWLCEGRVDRVLVGCVDEFCPVLGYCWQRYFGSELPEVQQPLRLNSQSAIPGEGAAIFLLSRDQGQAAYGHIAHVEYGRGILPSFNADLTLIGADGHRVCGQRYRDELAPGMWVAAASASYGSLPVGSAFDLAIAAFSRKTGFWSLPIQANDTAWDQMRPGAEMADLNVACVKCGNDNDYGLLILEP